MKAKRIADITANIADLKKQVSILSESLNKEHGATCAASMIAQAIINSNTAMLNAELSAVISTPEKKNSDQLREEMSKNNKEINRLTERNEVILTDLRRNGLTPVEREYHRKPKEFILQEPCKVSFNKVMSFKGYVHTPKLLTCEDLKLGGWFCRDVGNRSAVAFVDAGLEVCLFHEWGRSYESYAGCVLNLEGRKVDRVYTIEDSYFEIVRFGNQFYRV